MALDIVIMDMSKRYKKINNEAKLKAYLNKDKANATKQNRNRDNSSITIK